VFEHQEKIMSEDQRIGRREAIKGLATGVGGVVTGLPILNNVVQAQGHHHPVAAALTKELVLPQAPTFFNKEQYAMITELASLIIPTDDTPGANEAKVNEYIDMIVGESDDDTKKLYVDGLAWLDKTSMKRHNFNFLNLSLEQRVQILTEISQIKDATPENQLQAKFFKAIKNITIDGFYTSKIGIEELGYIGNTVLDEFPGCTHPEHQS
jgi:gluconate 2-dehydrogenase gamma chain